MTVSLPRVLLYFALSTIYAQSIPRRHTGTESMGNIVSSFFGDCLVHIIEQSGEVDMDFGALQGPMMLHRLQKYRNLDDVRDIVTYLEEKARFLQRGDIFRKFSCLLAIVSTSDEDAGMIRKNVELGKFDPLLHVLDQRSVLAAFSKSVRKIRSYLVFLYSCYKITALSFSKP